MLAINEFLHDPAAQRLLALTARRCLTWEDFLQLQLPNNTSPTETWTLLNDLNKTLSVPTPIADFENVRWWYRRTCDIDDAVHDIVTACSSGSLLHKALQQTEGHHFVMKMRVDETVAAALLDGLAVPSDDAEGLLRLERPPRNAPERLLLNTFSVMSRIPEYIDEPFSPELLLHIRDMLLEGVDIHELRAHPQRRGIVIGDYKEELAVRYARRQLRDICAYLNHETADPADLPALIGPLMADSICFYRPLGDISSQVGRIVAQLHAVKNDLPVLAMLPISKTKLDWENGVPLPGVPFDKHELNELNQKAHGDATGHQTIAARLILATIADATEYALKWERDDIEMRALLKGQQFLNHRQRSILARGLRVPNAEFRIKYHQVNHNIAYPTARRDLLELEAQGYLTMTQKGKAFVFQPGPRLQELVAQKRHVF